MQPHSWGRRSLSLKLVDARFAMVVVDLEDSDWFGTLMNLARDNGARLCISTLDTPPREISDPSVLGPTAVAIAGTDFLRETAWTRGGILWARPEFDGVVRHDQPILHHEPPVTSLALAGGISDESRNRHARRVKSPADFTAHKKTPRSAGRFCIYGGEGGIRTRDTVTRMVP